MLRMARLSLLIGLLVALAGCTTFNIRSDWDPSISFEKMNSFYWVEPPQREGVDPFADNSLLRKRVRLAVEAAFVERGFALVDSREAADALVTYSVILEERVRVDGVSGGAGYGDGYYRGGYGRIYSTSSVRNYQESTLIIDLLDPKSEDLLWRGWGARIVGTRDRERRRRQERMDDGVRAIFAKFPPENDEGS